MQPEGTFFFQDAAGKFDAVKEELRDAFCHTHDLAVYSLTPAGKDAPEHLVLKMTPAGKMEGYLSLNRLDVDEAVLSMRLLDYETFSASWLMSICQRICGEIRSAREDMRPGHNVTLAECTSQERYLKISAEAFFTIAPREDEAGAQVYLRDKAFFLSMLPDPEMPSFSALTLLSLEQMTKVTFIDMSRADLSGRTKLNDLFEYCKMLRELDLSTLDTSNVTDMRGMFSRCESLQRLDLSTFDFSHVKDMRSMFMGCRNLEEVILSDTILRTDIVSRIRDRLSHSTIATGRTVPYTTEELNEIYKMAYISDGPQLAQRAVEQAEKSGKTEYQSVKVVPSKQAVEAELCKHLALTYDQQKLTIVPHRAPKTKTEAWPKKRLHPFRKQHPHRS